MDNGMMTLEEATGYALELQKVWRECGKNMKKQTNYEKYFGTPEKVIRMRVRYVHDDIIGPMLIVEEVSPDSWNYPYQTWTFYRHGEFLEWLQEQAK